MIAEARPKAWEHDLTPNPNHNPNPAALAGLGPQIRIKIKSRITIRSKKLGVRPIKILSLAECTGLTARELHYDPI